VFRRMFTAFAPFQWLFWKYAHTLNPSGYF
jgi:hypothetical protein